MKSIEKTLQDIGLEETEVKIYLALLKYGGGTVSDIATTSGVKRPTVYQYIDRLAARDIIRKTVRGKRLLYYAEDPKHLIKMAERITKKAEAVFPELSRLYVQSSRKPVVRFYEGKVAIREVYREVTKTSKKVWSVFSSERYFELFSEDDGDEFLANIRKNGGELRDLVLDTPAGRRYVKEKWGAPVAKSKLLPREFDFSVDMLVAGDVLVLISFEHLIAVVVENQEIADLHTQFIRFVWKNVR